CDRLENRIGIEPVMLCGALELERQHIQQNLAVGVRVDMAEIELEQLALQRLAVGQVAVVTERDAERRIDVERLRFKVGKGGARRRVPPWPKPELPFTSPMMARRNTLAT